MSRQALGWLLVYRLSLALVLILVFFYPQIPNWLSSGGDPSIVRLLLKLQTLSILFSGVLMLLGHPQPARQIELASFLDIVFYTALMHVSGGISTGLGLILAIVVAVGAILLEGRLSLLFAALATLAVMFQTFYAELYATTPSGGYTQAGLLGLTYFTVALLAHVLARRLHETEHLAARRKVDLADLSKLNEIIIQSLSTGVLAVNGERALLVMNNAAKCLLGVEQVRSGAALARVCPKLDAWLRQAVQDASGRDEVLALAEHEVRPRLRLLGSFRADGALIFLDDNRQLVREAQELKLASLGRLTASIAHNIRNPLSSITHATQLLAETEPREAEERHLLDIVQRNALRIDETVTSVLELSRRHQPQPQVLELNAWLSEFCEEYRASGRLESDRLVFYPASEVLSARIDPRHLGQILRNLCDNAMMHAKPKNGTPSIEISLTPSANRELLHLNVSDNGSGVATEHIRQLFDPFFTTSSQGTGLGLYAARELCEANGLRLEYIEQPAPGAQFRLLLNAERAQDDDQGQPAQGSCAGGR